LNQGELNSTILLVEKKPAQNYFHLKFLGFTKVLKIKFRRTKHQKNKIWGLAEKFMKILFKN
jgi:hypothetical protein